MNDRIGDGRPVDHVECLAETDIAAAFAFAGTFTRRPTEHVKKSDLDLRVGNLAGPKSDRHTRDPARGTRRHVQGIEQLLGGQSPRRRMREIQRIVIVPLVRPERPLVGLAACHFPDEPLQIETVGDEPAGQLIKQWRVGRRVAGPNVINRIDDAATMQVAPVAVDDALGEVGILRRRQPVGQADSRVGVLLVEIAGERKRGGNGLAGAGMLDVGRGGQRVDDLFTLDRPRLAADSGKIRRELVILPLRPPFEWMVVTLVALETGSDEDLCHVLHHHLRFP